MNYLGGSQKWTHIYIKCISSDVNIESELLSRESRTLFLTSNPVNNYPHYNMRIFAFLPMEELVFFLRTPDPKWRLNR